MRRIERKIGAHMIVKWLILAAMAVTAFDAGPARAEDPVRFTYSRAEMEAKWRARLDSFLAKGVIPLIDLESTISRRQVEEDLLVPQTLAKMDELGIALIAFEADQAPPGRGAPQQGFRWGYHMHEAVNAHPDRFIPTTNGGISENWRRQLPGMIGQTEAQVRSGDYAIMGEFEFRHYLSQGECKEGRDREVNIPLDAPNGHRLFALSAETGVPFLIHNEPEDAALDALEKMLRAYPKARVIQAHFGQIRFPNRQKRFTPGYVRHLLTAYPNLFYDISVGAPGRLYDCQGQKLLDTVIWSTTKSSQSDKLDPAYKAIFVDFSDRFVSGMDYGGGRPRLARFWEERAKNLRLILRDLPDKAKHNIAYRNAWKLLTGRDFAP